MQFLLFVSLSVYRLSCGVAAFEIGDLFHYPALEQAGRNRGAVAALAIGDDEAIPGKFGATRGELAERNVEAAIQGSCGMLVGCANVEQASLRGSSQRGRVQAQPLDDQFRVPRERGHAAIEKAGNTVEADATEADADFVFATGVGDHDDGNVGRKQGAAPGGEGTF